MRKRQRAAIVSFFVFAAAAVLCALDAVSFKNGGFSAFNNPIFAEYVSYGFLLLFLVAFAAIVYYTGRLYNIRKLEEK